MCEPADAAAIAAILGREIREGTAHYGSAAPTVHAVALDIATAELPWLVAVDDGVAVGFVRCTPWKPRAAYDWTAEVGVYVAPSHQGRGVGRRLLGALLPEAERAGLRTLHAGISLPNPASRALFERAGFVLVGVFPRVGYKHGAWRDAGYWTLHLGDGAPGPRPTRADAAHLPIVVVDAFAERPFEGNPAAVMCLPRWLPDETLARIARENNLSETAFVVTSGGEHHLRWFTPTVEVALCGHATLAAGSVLLADREHAPEEIVFHTRSGPLRVAREGAGFSLDLPSHPAGAPGVPGAVVAALGREPVGGWAVKALHHADYWLVEYPDEATIAALTPDFGALRAQRANVICTAVGRDFDFVSRFFAPGSGVDEDPVTGSAHATLAPFWATRLQTTTLRARQISARGGTVGCVLRGDRVVLTGGCVEVTRGVLTLPPPSEP